MNEPQKLRKKRAFTPEKARQARKQGHDDALLFAKSIGVNKVYKNDLKAKKRCYWPFWRFLFCQEWTEKVANFSLWVEPFWRRF